MKRLITTSALLIILGRMCGPDANRAEAAEAATTSRFGLGVQLDLFPTAFAFADDGFENPTTSVLATMIDYTFGDHFDGLWLGVGIERWKRTIEHTKVDGQASWSNVILTAGGGYIWRVWRNFYVDPWVGLHWTADPETVSLGEYSYDAPRIAVNASVKLGVFTDW